jgi:sirohydrochlorin cobaltochelatase
MSKTCAVLLSHGSRDASADLEMKKCAKAYQARHPEITVRFAYLELAEPFFIYELEKAAQAFKIVRILPLFLFPGSHLKKDIPEIIKNVQAKNPQTQFQLAPSLGTSPVMAELILARLASAGYPSDPGGKSALLVGHGTREPESQEPLKEMVSLLGQKKPTANITPCFIGLGAPSLREALEQLKSENHPAEIWVAPYLLFPGNFLEKIKETLQNFQSENPAVKIFIAPPLGAHEFLFQILDSRLTEP